MRTFSGESKNGAPILAAGFWKKGTKIQGRVMNMFDTAVGKCYTIVMMDAITVPGEHLSPPQDKPLTTEEISVGALKGFDMAIRASGCGTLQNNDVVKIECIGFEKTTKGSPRVNFKIDVTR